MNVREAQAWVVLSIAVWNADAAIRRELDNVADFADWARDESERLIRSVVEVNGPEQ